MNKNFFKKLLFICLSSLILVTLNPSLMSIGKASPIDCGIYNVQEVSMQKENLDSSSEDVTIQCGGLPRQIWTSITSSAKRTPQESGRVNNYTKKGGVDQALADFTRMPGPYQIAAGGVRLKHYSGGTLAYYPKSTSTKTPTLSFPSTKKGVTDKVRYE